MPTFRIFCSAAACFTLWWTANRPNNNVTSDSFHCWFGGFNPCRKIFRAVGIMILGGREITTFWHHESVFFNIEKSCDKSGGEWVIRPQCFRLKSAHWRNHTTEISIFVWWYEVIWTWGTSTIKSNFMEWVRHTRKYANIKYQQSPAFQPCLVSISTSLSAFQRSCRSVLTNKWLKNDRSRNN